MLPVIIANYNRLNLLKQTLESLFKNSATKVQPIVVDDGSTDGGRGYLEQLQAEGKIIYYPMEVRSGQGACRNRGASFRFFAIAPSPKYIYFSDNDVYFEKDWDKKMISVLEKHPEIGILGGLRHPHHPIYKKASGFDYIHQQSGYSMMMPTKVWERLKPFFEHPVGEYGKEDSDICERCEKKGYKIAAMNPPVIVHCGLKTSEGQPTAGYPELAKIATQRPNLLFE